MKSPVYVLRFLLISFFAFTYALHANAQCLSGNCHDGSGSYRYSNGAVYTGQFAYGKPNGRGEFRDADRSLYAGDFKDGKPHGQGKKRYENGNEYVGQFAFGTMSGEGSMVYSNGHRYAGQWSDGKPNGRGNYHFKSRDRYEGSFIDGHFDGFGTLFYADGSYFAGNWSKNKKHGPGKLVHPDGTSESGRWEDGKLIYVGSSPDMPGDQPKQTSSAVTQMGQSQTGHRLPDLSSLRNCNSANCGSGKGYYTYPDGSIWVGQFRDGRPMGSGVCYYSNGDRYEGNWSVMAPNGEGIMHFATGRVYGAVWVNGSPIQELNPIQTMPVVTPAPTVRTDDVRIFAVVVGVGKYLTMPALTFTDDDAHRFYAFLKRPEGGALQDNQVTLLLDEDATRKNILAAMQEYFLRADENDVVMFYFSGHGLRGSFLPVDYDGHNNRLRHDEIRAIFDQSKAKHKLCIADACHSGSLKYDLMVAKGPAPISLDNYYKAFDESSGGIALLMSSNEEELSLEDHGLRQGVFTYYLLEGLKGDADANGDRLVTIQEIYQYVAQKVRYFTSGIQSPVLTGQFDVNMPVSWRRF
jgi:hypothetical protein